MPKVKKTKKKTPQKARKDVKFLGVGLNSTTMTRVLTDVLASLRKKEKFLVVTPNPEQLVLASKDAEYKAALDASTMALPDGIGLAAAARYNSFSLPKVWFKGPVALLQGLVVGAGVVFGRNWLTKSLPVIRGRETFDELVKVAGELELRIFLFGSSAEIAHQNISQHPKSTINDTNIASLDAPWFDESAKPKSKDDVMGEKYAIDMINKFKPHILFVGIQPPKQEKWLAKNWDKLNIGGAMVVGSTFDQIAGAHKLTPTWMAKAGLEWLWRALTGTKNLKRIWDAVVVFPWMVFNEKLNA